MGYIYSIACVIMAFIILVKYTKENKIFYLVSTFLLYVGTWWFLNSILYINLFSGMYLVIFRIISIIVLISCLFVYNREKNKVNKY